MSTLSYPVRLVGGDDLRRSRLTVFFRLLLLIPHVIVLALYGVAAFFAAIAAWFVGVFTGRVPHGVHSFIAGYLRYSIRVGAFATILADPFPPFGSSRRADPARRTSSVDHRSSFGASFGACAGASSSSIGPVRPSRASRHITACDRLCASTVESSSALRANSRAAFAASSSR